MEQGKDGKYTSLESALANPEAVKILDLKNQGIQKLPDEISALVNLEQLDLSDNLLSSLPLGIANLPIRYLLLGRNRFTHIPLILTGLRRIEEIDIAQNTIKTVPNEIAYLREKLTFLNIKDNFLEEKEELKLIRFLPETEINFSYVKSYQPEGKERNFIHIQDRKAFSWQKFLIWMSFPATIAIMTLILRVIYLAIAPDLPE